MKVLALFTITLITLSLHNTKGFEDRGDSIKQMAHKIEEQKNSVEKLLRASTPKAHGLKHNKKKAKSLAIKKHPVVKHTPQQWKSKIQHEMKGLDSMFAKFHKGLTSNFKSDMKQISKAKVVFGLKHKKHLFKAKKSLLKKHADGASKKIGSSPMMKKAEQDFNQGFKLFYGEMVNNTDKLRSL